MKKSILVFGLFICLKSLCFSQQKLYRAALPEVAENGFYKINLRPEIVSYCKPGLEDLRLTDQKDREVPYLLERTASEKNTRYFREYPVVSKRVVPKAGTTLVIQNPDRSKINNIGLRIKNTNVRKMASLSGSPDAENWYALEDDYLLQTVANPKETSEVKVLHFPLSDYEFYKLEINDSASAPLNILAAGYYDFTAEKGQYEPVRNLPFKRTDSTEVKKTYLWFSPAHPVQIDKLTFQIDSATFYLRNATVFVRETVFGRRNKRTETWVPVQHFQLKADSENAIQLSDFRAKEFCIEIDNADNPPLEIQAVNAYQLKTYLIAELKKGRNYALQFGDEKAILPVYDLAYFREKIPEKLPVLEPLAIAENAISEAPKSDLNRYFQQKSLIWLALILVIGFLGYMTYKMLRETTAGR